MAAKNNPWRGALVKRLNRKLFNTGKKVAIVKGTPKLLTSQGSVEVDLTKLSAELGVRLFSKTSEVQAASA